MSSSERYQRLHETFTRACELSGEERQAWLDEACAGNADLRREVEAMLLADHDTAAHLDTPVLGEGFRLEGMAAALGPEARLVGRRLGRYHLTGVIASGGMGTVYEATQENPHRTVAVKVMRPGLASGSALRRFEYEAQILARLRHPGIAQIFEAGTSDEIDGLPYFVMEYVPGALPLTEYARRGDLSARDRLELFARVCDAVSHGHQRGIIHRDLKPANILVDAGGQPKIIDFGIARATDSDIALTTMQTDVGQLLGTLQYMSPEQCDADPHALDTRSDVYSLGVVLYELLCGQVPYDVSRAAVHEAARLVREAAPARPSTISRTVRGDLETITLKALEKSRDRRYQSSADLAADIRRYLGDEPIMARPPSAMYQIRKFALRHRALAGSAAVAVLALAAAAVISTTALMREAQQRGLAEAQSLEATRQKNVAKAINDFFRNDLLRSVSPNELGHEVTMREALDAAAENLKDQFADEPEVAAALHEVIGMTYIDLGEFGPVEAHLLEAASLLEQSLGAEDESTIALRTELAGFYELTSRYDEAESITVPLLEVARRRYGEVHIRTAAILTELGNVSFSRGDYAKAEAYHREALPIYRTLGTSPDADTARCLTNLAMALRYQERFEEAAPLYEESIAIMRELYGDENPETLGMINNYGGFLFGSRRYEEAVTVFRDLLAAYERVLPPDHPTILHATMNLAANLRAVGRNEEATAMLEDVLPGLRRVSGPTDFFTLIAASNLAACYSDADRLDEAEALFNGTIQALEAVDPHHNFLAGSVVGLANIQAKREDFAEADGNYTKALEILRFRFPETHTEVLRYERTRVLTCLLPWGRFEEAEREILASYEACRSALGEPDPRTRSMAQTLMTIYEQWGRAEDAARWRERAEASVEEPGGEP